MPGVWSDSAKEATSKCAEKAGMGKDIYIISEPEAAATYAFHKMAKNHNVEKDDTIVVCDAGGGTVDLISYKVACLKPILKLTETSPGIGSLCGSSILNRCFQEFLSGKLEDCEDWDNDVLEEVGFALTTHSLTFAY